MYKLSGASKQLKAHTQVELCASVSLYGIVIMENKAEVSIFFKGCSQSHSFDLYVAISFLEVVHSADLWTIGATVWRWSLIYVQVIMRYILYCSH